MLLTKEQIFEADDLETEVVLVPEWGKDGKVKVRALTGRERDRLESTVALTNNKGEQVGTNLDNLRARLCAMTMVDEAGKLIFTSKDDVLGLGRKSGTVLNRVFEAAQRLSGLTVEDVEKLTKNSNSDLPEGSPTD